MVPITSLWLPILLSAVAVFAISSIIHMLLPYHRSDFKRVPREDAVMDALRAFDIPPGDYVIPCAGSSKEMSSPEYLEKVKKGPVAFVTFMTPGPPAMGKSLALWFGFSLLLGIFAAYLAGRLLGPGTDYLTVFRVTGTVTFIGYGVGSLGDSIWKGVPWSVTFKNLLDALIYALLTGGVFGWLWP